MTTTKELTKRDIQLLKGLKSGQADKQIAETTGLTIGTVRVYLHALYKKIKVKNRTEAAVWYINYTRSEKK